MKIVVHIDRLVLEGFPPGVNTRRLGAAVERELTRTLLATPFENWRGGDVDHIAAPNGGLTATDGPEALGRSIAQAASFGVSATQQGDIQPPRTGRGEEQP